MQPTRHMDAGAGCVGVLGGGYTGGKFFREYFTYKRVCASRRHVTGRCRTHSTIHNNP